MHFVFFASTVLIEFCFIIASQENNWAEMTYLV